MPGIKKARAELRAVVTATFEPDGDTLQALFEAGLTTAAKWEQDINSDYVRSKRSMVGNMADQGQVEFDIRIVEFELDE